MLMKRLFIKRQLLYLLINSLSLIKVNFKLVIMSENKHRINMVRLNKIRMNRFLYRINKKLKMIVIKIGRILKPELQIKGINKRLLLELCLIIYIIIWRLFSEMFKRLIGLI